MAVLVGRACTRLEETLKLLGSLGVLAGHPRADDQKAPGDPGQACKHGKGRKPASRAHGEVAGSAEFPEGRLGRLEDPVVREKAERDDQILILPVRAHLVAQGKDGVAPAIRRLLRQRIERLPQSVIRFDAPNHARQDFEG